MGLRVEVPDGVDDGPLLVFAQLGVDREGQDLGGGPLAYGEVTGLVT